MHPGYVNPDVIAPSGPVDPALTVLSIQSTEGRPLALLANYSQHYFGASPVSADYYGRFAAALARKIGTEQGGQPFVGIMSQGTSGDQMWMDYGRPRNDPGIDRYADEVAESAYRAYQSIKSYHDHVHLAMAETTLTLRRRVPDETRLKWAKQIVARMGDRVPRSLPEVYAKEAVFLHEQPERELKLQAIRIGELGITAIPDEVYALTGLKIKARSPLPLTMNIALGNGSEGYIPPPEQHVLGGYTTWPARTAALEVQAEPKIVATVLGLLEKVAGKPRRQVFSKPAPYTEHILAARPLAYWRLEEMEGQTAHDASGHEHEAQFRQGCAFYLPGTDLPGFHTRNHINRAPHLAGGRITAALTLPAESYSVEFWFWNGLPVDARPVTAYLFERSAKGQASDTLGMSGSATGPAGRLFVSRGDSKSLVLGNTEIRLKTWHHVVLVRSGRRVAVYLDGAQQAEISAELEPGRGLEAAEFSFGGRHAGDGSLEGKLDEIALYDRSLTPSEIAEHYRAAANPTTGPAR
jgi:Concanavalin A-like lectin/glucanases superfamily